MDMNLSKLWETVDRGVWHAVVHGVRVRHNLVTEQQKGVFIYLRYKSFIRYNNNEKFEIFQVTKL